MVNSHTTNFHKRIVILTVFLLLGFLAVVYRLVVLQVVSADYYQALGSGRRTIIQKLLPTRGEIKISDKFSSTPYTVATTIEKPLVYAIPQQIKDAAETAQRLGPVLKLEPAEIQPKLLETSKKYVPLKKQLTDEEVEQIQALGLAGIAFDAEVTRFYPENELLSQVLGFVGYKGNDKVGLYGLEANFETVLKGAPGTLSQERAGGGAYIYGTPRNVTFAQDGDNLLLTIDKTLQFKAESILKNAVTVNEADSGSMVIVEPKTGAILALANYPGFNPNAYAKVEDPALYSNKAVTGNYEPGSVFKPLTMAAAINEGKVTPETTYTDTGQILIDTYTIRNADTKAHGVQSMTQVLQESLNTGIIFAKEQIGNDMFLEYIKKFGFGKKTGVELPETPGNIKNLESKIKVNFHTASFGQGINVTPLQLVQAYTALANGGKMMKPYIVQARISPEGAVTKTEPESRGQVISEKTASTISAMLVNVVERGHGKKAGVPGYYIAGKTGTAQVPKKDGKGYEENNNIGSFVGYGPVEDPKFLMLVRVNHPRAVTYAETTAAPAFGEMAQFILNYYNIPPTRK
jgi:cell division protein FtsI (penicillin-binding protein 3)